MGRSVHDAGVAPEDVLRAVAVVDIEVNDGDTLQSVYGLRVTCGDGGVVEDAKTHRRRRFGVVAGRPGDDESVVGPRADDLVDGEGCPTGRAQRRFPCARRHRRVGVELHDAHARARLFERRDIVARMDARQRLEGGARRDFACKKGEGRGRQRVLDSADSRRPLGMALAHVVSRAGRMRHQQRRHQAGPLNRLLCWREHRRNLGESPHAALRLRVTIAAAARARRSSSALLPSPLCRGSAIR